MNGAAKYINANGGIARPQGAKSTSSTRTSTPTSRATRSSPPCQQDFALVGTEALFLTNMDDAINCKDINGQATGLPDLAAIATGIPETCAPVTYTPTGPQLLCDTKDQHPQTYQGNQGDTTYYKKNVNKNLTERSCCPTTPRTPTVATRCSRRSRRRTASRSTSPLTASGS